MIYYPKPMSHQTAFAGMDCVKVPLSNAAGLCERVLALPMHPYISYEEQDNVITSIRSFAK